MGTSEHTVSGPVHTDRGASATVDCPIGGPPWAQMPPREVRFPWHPSQQWTSRSAGHETSDPILPLSVQQSSWWPFGKYQRCLREKLHFGWSLLYVSATQAIWMQQHTQALLVSGRENKWYLVRAEKMAPSITSLPHKHKDLSWTPRTSPKELYTLVHVYNPNAGEAETGKSLKLLSHLSSLCSYIQASERHPLRKKKKADGCFFKNSICCFLWPPCTHPNTSASAKM